MDSLWPVFPTVVMPLDILSFQSLCLQEATGLSLLLQPKNEPHQSVIDVSLGSYNTRLFTLKRQRKDVYPVHIFLCKELKEELKHFDEKGKNEEEFLEQLRVIFHSHYVKQEIQRERYGIG